MRFLELAKKRYSSRNYEERTVEEEKIMRILEAGKVAPTAKNLQPYKTYVFQKKENLEKIADVVRFYGAPLLFVVCKDTEQTWKRPFDDKDHGDVDAAIVTDHMMLEATEQGLQSVWICYYDAKKLASLLKLPSHIVPVNVLAVGYAVDDPKAENRHDEMRKKLEETVVFDADLEL
ncbi:MAG TPA: nitroreductase [Eubacteriaceae bacterium]|nr:nitroreductase [Eubacteriaceae bacterium]